MGFTLTTAGEAAEASEATPARLESDIMDDEVDEESARQEPAAQTHQPPPRSEAGPPIPIAIAINDSQSGQLFWRTLTSQVDTVIKANCTAQVIPSAHTIAMEVIKRGQESNCTSNDPFLAGSCRGLPEDIKDWRKGEMRRSNKTWQILAEMRGGDGKPLTAMTCQVMADMRGFERAAGSCR